MSRLARVVAGRRSKWAVVLAWIVLVALSAPLGQKVADVTDDRQQSFLPQEAESTKVLELQNERLPAAQTASGLIVSKRDGGLTAADRRTIADQAAEASQELPVVGKPVVPFQPGSPPSAVSPDRSIAYTVLAVPNEDEEKLVD